MDILKPVRDKGITASDLLGQAWDFQYEPEDEVDYQNQDLNILIVIKNNK